MNTFRVVRYRDTDIETVGPYGSSPRILAYLVRGYDESWETRGSDTVIPSAAGRVRRNRIRDVLKIEVVAEVMGTGSDDAAQRADLRAAVDSLKALFDNTLAPAELVIELEDGTFAGIDAAAVNTVSASPTSGDHHPTIRVLSFELEAIGDVWQAVSS